MQFVDVAMDSAQRGQVEMASPVSDGNHDGTGFSLSSSSSSGASSSSSNTTRGQTSSSSSSSASQIFAVNVDPIQAVVLDRFRLCFDKWTGSVRYYRGVVTHSLLCEMCMEALGIVQETRRDPTTSSVSLVPVQGMWETLMEKIVDIQMPADDTHDTFYIVSCAGFKTATLDLYYGQVFAAPSRELVGSDGDRPYAMGLFAGPGGILPGRLQMPYNAGGTWGAFVTKPVYFWNINDGLHGDSISFDVGGDGSLLPIFACSVDPFDVSRTQMFAEDIHDHAVTDVEKFQLNMRTGCVWQALTSFEHSEGLESVHMLLRCANHRFHSPNGFGKDKYGNLRVDIREEHAEGTEITLNYGNTFESPEDFNPVGPDVLMARQLNMLDRMRQRLKTCCRQQQIGQFQCVLNGLVAAVAFQEKQGQQLVYAKMVEAVLKVIHDIDEHKFHGEIFSEKMCSLLSQVLLTEKNFSPCFVEILGARWNDQRVVLFSGNTLWSGVVRRGAYRLNNTSGQTVTMESLAHLAAGNYPISIGRVIEWDNCAGVHGATDAFEADFLVPSTKFEQDMYIDPSFLTTSFEFGDEMCSRGYTVGYRGSNCLRKNQLVTFETATAFFGRGFMEVVHTKLKTERLACRYALFEMARWRQCSFDMSNPDSSFHGLRPTSTDSVGVLQFFKHVLREVRLLIPGIRTQAAEQARAARRLAVRQRAEQREAARQQAAAVEAARQQAAAVEAARQQAAADEAARQQAAADEDDHEDDDEGEDDDGWLYYEEESGILRRKVTRRVGKQKGHVYWIYSWDGNRYRSLKQVRLAMRGGSTKKRKREEEATYEQPPEIASSSSSSSAKGATKGLEELGVEALMLLWGGK